MRLCTYNDVVGEQLTVGWTELYGPAKETALSISYGFLNKQT
jgi:hypothetical protein